MIINRFKNDLKRRRVVSDQVGSLSHPSYHQSEEKEKQNQQLKNKNKMERKTKNSKSMRTKMMAVCSLFVVILFMGVMVSCEKGENSYIETKIPQNNEQKASLATRSIQVTYMINLSSYAHLQQPSIPGVPLTCGQTSYLVARRVSNSSFAPPTRQNVINLDNILAQNFSGSYGVTHIPDVRHLTWFAETYDGFSPEIFQKEERPSTGTTTPNHAGPVRQQFKAFIEGKLSSGKLVIVPCTFNFSTSSMGHFYIVVGLRNNSGTLEIGYKDVYYASSATSWVSYTTFLDGNWYNQAGWRWVSSGQYYTSDYVAYSLQ